LKAITDRLLPAGLAVALAAAPGWGLASGGQGYSGAPGPGRDATGEGLAFVETSSPTPTCYVGQRVELRVTFGVEAELLAERAVQPFGAPLEVPVQLRAPWLEDGSIARFEDVRPAGTDRAAAAPAAPTAGFALDERVARARSLGRRVEDGRSYAVYAIETAFVAPRRGRLALPGPVLSFAYATRFAPTLLREDAPQDRVDVFVRGAGLEFDVRPLPEQGRPVEFTDAVGRFSIAAEVEPREVTVGQSLRLRLEITGAGNLATFEPPHWTELGGFRVQGTLDESGPAARILSLDLAPRSDRVREVPAVSLHYFDPAPPGAYRVAATAPVAVTVHPAPSGTRSLRTPREAEAPPARRRPWLLPWFVLVTTIVVLAAVRRRRRRRG